MIAVHRLRSQEKKATKGLGALTSSDVEADWASTAWLATGTAGAGEGADALASVRTRNSEIHAFTSCRRASASVSCFEADS